MAGLRDFTSGYTVFGPTDAYPRRYGSLRRNTLADERLFDTLDRSRERRSDEELKEEIRAMLTELDLGVTNFDIAVEHGDVRLRGHLTNFAVQQKVESLIQGLPGVHEVNIDVRNAPVPTPV